MVAREVLGYHAYVLRLAVSLRDQSFAHTPSLGILRVSLGLTRALAQTPEVAQLTVLTNRELGACAGPESPRLRYAGLDVPFPRGRARLHWDQRGLAAALRASGARWALLPKGFMPLAGLHGLRTCCYLHDDIAFRAPHARVTPASLAARAYFGCAALRSAASADVLVVNSRFTAERIHRLWPWRAPAVPIGVGFDADGAERVPPRHLLLLVSAHPHKLSARSVAWLARWDAERGSPLPVLAVGALPRDAVWPARPHWTHAPRLDDARYATAQREAAVLIYVSGYEGYGMPPREALVSGRWAIASDLPAIREDVPAELLFDNASYDAFAARLDYALAGVRAHQAPPRCGAVGWREVCARLIAALEAHGG